ncbi:hypothetical protein IM40_03285 [Candidatus Paracaedimonas acanthamoebae]|nr:hypothetical protein IM40_03285 [Candidatus Paracaedimonas acanthamoebae]
MKAQEKKASIELESEYPGSNFLKKAIIANVIIFGLVLIGITLVIRHLNPTQLVNTLTNDLHKLEKRVVLAEEKIKLYETYFLTLNSQLETLSSHKNESTKQEIDTSYQKLISEFKSLMESEISLPLPIPFLGEGRLFKWFTRYVQIKETPYHQKYSKAYELLKQGNLLQAIELLRPLAHDPSSSLYLWLEKATIFQKSLSSED